MKKTYLSALYTYDKKVFSFVAVFATLTVFCNLMGKETTPFFVWGMYSEKFKPVKTYEIFRITINDSVLLDSYSGYSDNTRTFLNAPLAYYREMKDYKIDPTISFLKNKLKTKYAWLSPFQKKLFNSYNQQNFMNWYRCYLERVTGVPIHAIKIDVLRTQFNEDQHLFTDSSYLFETWRQD